MINYPEPKQKFKHYKGGKYEVIFMASDVETKEPIVVYQSLTFGTRYVRKLSDWLEPVQNGDETLTRFQLIDETNER